jgi:hypothetical protein
MQQRLFLLSNSTVFGRKYLEHALASLQDFLGEERSILFVPYAVAAANYDGYTTHIHTALAPLGAVVRGVHTYSDPRQAVTEARVLYVGGGNSFRLLKTLQQHQLLTLVRERVEAGALRYIGASAGTNMACPVCVPPTICQSSSHVRSRLLACFPSRSTRTISIRILPQLIRARRVPLASLSFSKRTMCPCWACARAPGCSASAKHCVWRGSLARASSRAMQSHRRLRLGPISPGC